MRKRGLSFFLCIISLLIISINNVFAKKYLNYLKDRNKQVQAKQVYPPFAVWYYEYDGKFKDVFFYPLGQCNYEKNRIYWRTFLGLFSYDIHFHKQQTYAEGKFFPFYFFKKGFGQENDYAAVWPLCGTVKTFLGKDRADWFLWPFWVKTINNQTMNYWFPWPIMNYRCGISHGFGFWPIGGHFYQKGVYDDRYMLWPLIYHRKDFDKNTIKRGFLPFYAYEKTPKIKDLSIVWPIWGHRHEYDKHYEEHRILWPLWVQAKGDDRLINRWGPFYTYSENKHRKSSKTWYLWPFIKQQNWQEKGIDFHQEQFLYFIFWHQEQKNHTNGKILGNKTHFWPIYSYWNNGQGHEQMQMLSPFEVFFQSNQMVRDLYTPFFNLFRYDKNNDVIKQSFLFNWIREERKGRDVYFHWSGVIDYKNTTEERLFSLLKGLLECRKVKGETTCRLFWIPLKNSKKTMKDSKLL